MRTALSPGAARTSCESERAPVPERVTRLTRCELRIAREGHRRYGGAKGDPSPAERSVNVEETMAKKRKPAKPRDPMWALRRMLRAQRVRNAKKYRRPDSKRAELDAKENADD